MNKYKCLAVICLIMTLVSVPIFSGGKQEAEKVEAKKVYFLQEGHLRGAGELSDAIEGFKVELPDASPGDAAEWKMRIAFWGEVEKILKAQGITAEGYDWGWAEPLVQKEVNAFLAGSGPEVIIGETQMPGFAARGYLQEFPPALTAKVKAEVMPGAYLPLTVDGKIYGIAPFPGVSVLFWNKELVKKAGLDPEKAPKTWDELMANSKAITAAGGGEFFGGGIYAGPHFGGSLRYGAWLIENGGGFVDENYAPIINHPANIETIKYVRELNKNTPPGVAGDPNEGAFWDSFNQEKMAYIIDGPWRKTAAANFGIEVGYSAIPLPTLDSEPAGIAIGAAMYGVPSYVKNKDIAFKFIEALLDKKVQDVIRDAGYRSPVIKAYLNEPEFMSSYMATFFKTFEGNVQGLPTFKGEQNAKIWEILHQAYSESIFTDKDIKTICDRAQASAMKLVE